VGSTTTSTTIKASGQAAQHAPARVATARGGHGRVNARRSNQRPRRRPGTGASCWCLSWQHHCTLRQTHAPARVEHKTRGVRPGTFALTLTSRTISPVHSRGCDPVPSVGTPPNQLLVRERATGGARAPAGCPPAVGFGRHDLQGLCGPATWMTGGEAPGNAITCNWCSSTQQAPPQILPHAQPRCCCHSPAYSQTQARSFVLPAPTLRGTGRRQQAATSAAALGLALEAHTAGSPHHHRHRTSVSSPHFALRAAGSHHGEGCVSNRHAPADRRSTSGAQPRKGAAICPGNPRTAARAAHCNRVAHSETPRPGPVTSSSPSSAQPQAGVPRCPAQLAPRFQARFQTAAAVTVSSPRSRASGVGAPPGTLRARTAAVAAWRWCGRDLPWLTSQFSCLQPCQPIRTRRSAGRFTPTQVK
jgi:hypothetical protein